MDSSVLRECLRTGHYALRDETFLLKERLSARERLKWVKQHRPEKDPSKEDVAMTMNEDGKYEHARDFWRKGAKGEIIRARVVPRFQLFTPVGSADCPVDLVKLEAYRDTFREGGYRRERLLDRNECTSEDDLPLDWRDRFLREKNI